MSIPGWKARSGEESGWDAMRFLNAGTVAPHMTKDAWVYVDENDGIHEIRLVLSEPEWKW